MSEPTQSEIPIPAEAIEAAQDAYMTKTGRVSEGGMEAAIRRFLSEMQFKVEQQTFNESKKIEGVIRPVERQRLVSPWKPSRKDEQ